MKKNLFYKIFLWMFIGLLVTFITAYVVSLNEVMVRNIFSGITRYILIIAELGIGIFLGVRVWKLKPATATCLFLFYTFLTGLTFSSIFIVYKITSIMFVFGIAALLFGIFAILGKILKLDLTKISTFLLMMLIGVMVLGIVNMFIGSSMLTTVISCVSLVVFLGFVAYDINRMKEMVGYSGDKEQNLAILGAFSLYIDFINIFIDLLNLFGGNSRD